MKKHALILTSMAFALPGIASTADGERQVDYQFSFYRENDDRMTVRAHQTRITTRFEKIKFRLDLIKDVVSGASPMFNMPGPDGKTVQVLSGASIREQRDVANLNLASNFRDWDIALNAGVSSENDYLSRSTALELGHDFNQKNTRLTLGWGPVIG